MPAWAALLGTLGYNYRRHKAGRSTICGVSRRLLPWPAMVAAWCAFSYVMLRHLRRGYPIP